MGSSPGSFPLEIPLPASTRNGGRSAGHRGRGHGAVAFLRSRARRNCLVMAASRNGLGTRMGREGGSDVHRNRVRFSGFGATFGTNILCSRQTRPAHLATQLRSRTRRRKAPAPERRRRCAPATRWPASGGDTTSPADPRPRSTAIRGGHCPRRTTTLEQSPDRLHTKVVETCPAYLLEDIRGQAEHGPRRGQWTQVASKLVSQWPPRVTHSDADGNTPGPQSSGRELARPLRRSSL
jgi:hypothetical protein